MQQPPIVPTTGEDRADTTGVLSLLKGLGMDVPLDFATFARGPFALGEYLVVMLYCGDDPVRAVAWRHADFYAGLGEVAQTALPGMFDPKLH